MGEHTKKGDRREGREIFNRTNNKYSPKEGLSVRGEIDDI
jgi:hypothetical protein